MTINNRLTRLEKALAYRLETAGRPRVKVYEVGCDGEKRFLWEMGPNPLFTEIRIHRPCEDNNSEEYRQPTEAP